MYIYIYMYILVCFYTIFHTQIFLCYIKKIAMKHSIGDIINN